MEVQSAAMVSTLDTETFETSTESDKQDSDSKSTCSKSNGREEINRLSVVMQKDGTTENFTTNGTKPVTSTPLDNNGESITSAHPVDSEMSQSTTSNLHLSRSSPPAAMATPRKVRKNATPTKKSPRPARSPTPDTFQPMSLEMKNNQESS